MPLEDRLDLARRAFERVDSLRRPDAPLFVLSATSGHGEQAKRTYDIRVGYNRICREFCEGTTNAYFVNLDQLLAPEDFVDSDHYTRTGYFKIAEFVNGHAVAAPDIEETPVAVAETKLASKPKRARSKTPAARTKAAKTAASRRAGASAAVSAG